MAVSFGNYLWHYDGNRSQRELRYAKATIAAQAVGPSGVAAMGMAAPVMVPTVVSVSDAAEPQAAPVVSETGFYRDSPIVDPVSPVVPAAPASAFADVGVPSPGQSVAPVVVAAPASLPAGWSVVGAITVEVLADGNNKVCVVVAPN